MQKIRIALIALLILALAIILVSTYMLVTKETSLPDNAKNNPPNRLVIKNEFSETYEGKNLPSDIDLEPIIPEVPVTADLVQVVDNRQVSQRNIVLKYRSVRTLADTRNLIKNDFESRGWDYLEREDFSMVGRSGKYEVVANVESIDSQEVLITMNVMIEN